MFMLVQIATSLPRCSCCCFDIQLMADEPEMMCLFLRCTRIYVLSPLLCISTEIQVCYQKPVTICGCCVPSCLPIYRACQQLVRLAHGQLWSVLLLLTDFLCCVLCYLCIVLLTIPEFGRIIYATCLALN